MTEISADSGLTRPTMLQHIRTIRATLKGRTDSEHEQAVLRIVIVAAVLAYMLVHYVPGRNDDATTTVLLYSLAIDLAFAFGVLAAICTWPAENVPRRALGMISDVTTATIVVYTTNEAGFAMIGVFLFITFGNGFRYGRTYLFVCQSLCLLGFGSALLLAPYWLQHQVAGWNLFVALVVLPIYVAQLLTRNQEARAKAIEANRAKSTFLANMSHEMRTPLNGIVGAVDLLKVTRLDSQQSELIRLLKHSSELMRSLVDDVLDISKIEAGRLTLEDLDFDLHALLNNLVNLLRPIAVRKGLHFEARIDPELDYRLRGDSHHLRQVLLNLASNAVKFTSKGHVRLIASKIGGTTDQVSVRFEVQDTGIGISEEAQKRIFDQFVQGDQSTTRRYGGSGLGTTIAKQLVELMGGSISVKSQLNEGSCFSCDITFRRAVNPAPAPTLGVPRVTLLLSQGEAATRILDATSALGITVNRVASSNEIPLKIRELHEGGVAITAVIICATREVARNVFNDLSVVERDLTLIHVDPNPLSSDEVHALPGIPTLRLESIHRTLGNAIHAAVTEGTEATASENLRGVLGEERTRLRILVAEDNGTNRAILSQLLTGAGHEVVLAKDGEEALDRYEHDAPALAIFDFNMPHRNGIEVTKAIRLMEFDHRMPIIILSASVTPESRERAVKAGADEFLGKPYDSIQLLRTIDRLAKATRSEGDRSVGQASVHFLQPTPIIDTDRLHQIQQLATTSKFLSTLIEGYQSDTLKLVDQIKRAAASEERSAVPDLAHALKGAALGIGAAQLALRCSALERSSMNARVEHLMVEALDIEQCMLNTNTELDAFLARQGDAIRLGVGSAL